jgi:hypothetical protein
MTTDTTAERFAVITYRKTDTPAGDYRPHFKTCGHTSPNCPAIKPSSNRLATDTLAEYMERNEHFDGEIIFAAPFRCRVCHPDVCNGGTCKDILQMCSKHSASYPRRYGRASNE